MHNKLKGSQWKQLGFEKKDYKMLFAKQNTKLFNSISLTSIDTNDLFNKAWGRKNQTCNQPT